MTTRPQSNRPPLPPEAFDLMSERFQALGAPSRLALLSSLMERERTVHELVEATGLTQTNVSRHLAVLRQAGLVARKARGNEALYSIGDPSIEALCHLVCDGLAERLNDGLGALGRSTPQVRPARKLKA